MSISDGKTTYILMLNNNYSSRRQSCAIMHMYAIELTSVALVSGSVAVHLQKEVFQEHPTAESHSLQVL